MQNSDIGPSPDVVRVFDALRDHKILIITGPPATGKTRLLSEVSRWFVKSPGVGFESVDDVPFPQQDDSLQLPSPSRDNRKVFRMVFHPGTRYRHLLRELEPTPNVASQFQYSKGVLFQANEYARSENGTALLVIDEINRGPAVEVFGDAVVSIEADKRLDENDGITSESYPFLLAGDDGNRDDYYLSSHLYIVAAMNSADASVAPFDVAFLRRWAPVALLPDMGVASESLDLPLPGGQESEGTQLLRALVGAWDRVNYRISLLRGSEYRLGHGVLIPRSSLDHENAAIVAMFVRDRWKLVEQHVAELFFGEPRIEAAVFGWSGVDDEPGYRLEQGQVGTEVADVLVRPNLSEISVLVEALGVVSRDDR